MLQAPLYFEDVEVGYKFQSPGGRTITNAEVVNFAQITGDYNLVHLDHEFAKTGMYGENIAHGALTLTLAGGMLKRTEFWSATAETLGDLTGFKHVKFMAPVKFNSTIHLECEITDKATTGRTITEADILNFAGISGEWAPIHMDLEYCKAHGHDSVLAQHMLIYTFTPSINPSDPMMAKMNNSILATKGTKNWKFLKMPAVGDTVYTTSEIVAKDDNKPERGVIIIQMSMIDQNGDVLQTGEYHLVVAKKIFFEKQFEAAAAKAQQ